MTDEPFVCLAWLIWCWQEGYRTPEDRAILGANWLLDDDAQLTVEDRATKADLLQMADEILAEYERPRNE